MLSCRLAYKFLLYLSFVWLYLFLPVPCSFAQNQTIIRISGVVTDSSTKQPLPGATVIETISKKAVLTNQHGFYELSVPSDKHEINCSFIGYQSISGKINALADTILNFALAPLPVAMKEVTVISEARDKQVRNVQTGIVALSRKDISGLPLFLGESDFYKTIQYMPGVQVSGEGNAAIYVRGGGYDQNLILLDQATVYNPTHLLGFYSVFNTDIVNDLTLIKSGMPAEYGNRISSVLEFTSKRAIPERIKTSGNVGIISSRINVDIPVFKKHGAVFLAARKTYLNSLLDIFRETGVIKHKSVLYKTGYDFYDLNASFVLTPTTKDRILFSIYKGDDWFVLNANNINLHANMDWGNQIGSLSWSHLFSSKFYVDHYLTYSGYGLKMSL
ncbi:MAG TPA: TonB-dependent receptor, partial [Bacteroidales bacterium]